MAGLSFPESRAQSVEMGIHRAMVRARVADLDRYRELVERSPEALDDLLTEMTVGETYFFREPAQFACIRREVLPDLRRRRDGEAVIRAWSAGCASGEEAYSLAILMQEEGFGERAWLLATDVSRTALDRARRASFTAWSLRGPGAGAVEPYVSRQGASVLLQERIRRLVRFEYLNLAQDVYPSAASGIWGMDLILCRNVLIYFDRETVPRRVARRLYDTLAPEWLAVHRLLRSAAGGRRSL